MIEFQPPYYIQGHQPAAQAAQSPSSLALNVSRNGASTTTLSNLFQCLTILTIKDFFLIIQSKSPHFQCETAPLCPVTREPAKESVLFFLLCLQLANVLVCQALINFVKSYPPRDLLKLNNSASHEQVKARVIVSLLHRLTTFIITAIPKHTAWDAVLEFLEVSSLQYCSSRIVLDPMNTKIMETIEANLPYGWQVQLPAHGPHAAQPLPHTIMVADLPCQVAQPLSTNQTLVHY